jgi:predicted nucleic acid-binding protein
LKALVVDASVVLKWCLPSQLESLVAQASQLLQSYESGELGFLAPDLLWAEVGNGLWKAVRREMISPAQAATALELLRQLSIAMFRSSDLLPQALHIAVLHNRTVYDSLYVALAMEASTELITADERLANALAARFPVKWLGAM